MPNFRCFQPDFNPANTKFQKISPNGLGLANFLNFWSILAVFLVKKRPKKAEIQKKFFCSILFCWEASTYQISENQVEWFSRYDATNKRTNKQTGLILYGPLRFVEGTNQLTWLNTVPTASSILSCGMKDSDGLNVAEYLMERNEYSTLWQFLWNYIFVLHLGIRFINN